MITMFLLLNLQTAMDIANQAPIGLMEAGMKQSGMAFVGRNRALFDKNDIVRSPDQRNVIFYFGSKDDEGKTAVDSAWKYSSESAQTTWRNAIVKSFQMYFKESDIVRKSKIERGGKLWREAIRIEEKCDGIGAAGNFCAFQLDYASGAIIAGQVYNSAYFVRETPKLDATKIEKRLAQDGQFYDEKRLTKRWLPFNYVYASRIRSSNPDLKMAPKENATVLVTIAEVKRNGAWSTFYFTQSGDCLTPEP